MKKYTKEQITECKAYLSYCVKHGAMDELEAGELVKNKEWKRIYDLMDYAEYLADSYKDEGGDLSG